MQTRPRAGGVRAPSWWERGGSVIDCAGGKMYPQLWMFPSRMHPDIGERPATRHATFPFRRTSRSAGCRYRSAC